MTVRQKNIEFDYILTFDIIKTSDAASINSPLNCILEAVVEYFWFIELVQLQSTVSTQTQSVDHRYFFY